MIKVIATLCSLANGACHDQIVTSSDFAEISMQSCMLGMAPLADWMKQHPAERLAGWKCVIGDRRTST